MSQEPYPYVVDAPSRASRIVLMQCPVAGFQFHDGETCWHRMRDGDVLALRREPGNRHDPRAIAIAWKGVMLGYVPREANFTVSQMMDRGESVDARIASLKSNGDPWSRVMVELDWRPFPRHRESASTQAREEAVSLGTFATSTAPEKITLIRPPESVGERAQQLGARVLELARVEVARRLALPVIGFVSDGRRVVHIWDLVEIAVADDGRWLSVKSLDPNPISRTIPRADLRVPMGAASWTGPFDALIGRLLAAHGASADAMPSPRGIWMMRCLQRTFRGFVDFNAMRKAALGYLAPDALTRSLANRLFGNHATADEFNWCGRRCASLALFAIEHPRLLPFLRLTCRDETAGTAELLRGLERSLAGQGMDPAAVKRLEEWGFEPFDEVSDHPFLGLDAIVDYANLLARLDVAGTPPGQFTECAGYALGAFFQERGKIFGATVPDWFMRALLRAVHEIDGPDEEAALYGEFQEALDWVTTAVVNPDANQRKAGWPWIVAHASAFAIQQATGEWPVPLEDFTFDDYRVVAMRTKAQLEEEGAAMKNCLANYADVCRRGRMAVFSVREAGGRGKRLADFAVERVMVDDRAAWRLTQVAGKMNAAVPAHIEAIAIAVAATLNDL